METPFPPIQYSDRKTGLVVFGIFTILAGAFCALSVPLMLFGQTLAAKNGAPLDAQAILPATFIYGALAVVQIWLGVGSIMARRWARALLLIFSWDVLITGVLSMFVMGFVMPQMMEAMKSANRPGQAQVTPEMQSTIMVVMLVFMGVIMVVIPAVWVIFYQSKNVKATCEALDPIVRWTDRCPLQVLNVSLWLAFSVPMMLLMPLSYRGVIAMFGTIVSGPLGSAIYLLLAVIWAYCAWAFYKLDRRGWWVLIICLALFAISTVVTYSRHDISELYVSMGYSGERLAQLQKFSMVKGGNAIWFSLIWTAPLLGYLIYLRKFFPPTVAKQVD